MPCVQSTMGYVLPAYEVLYAHVCIADPRVYIYIYAVVSACNIKVIGGAYTPDNKKELKITPNQ